jgi:hypothetical protein
VSYNQSGNLVFKGTNAISGTTIISIEEVEVVSDLSSWWKVAINIPIEAPLGSATIETVVVSFARGIS